MPNEYTKTSAIISHCKKYRYELTREWALTKKQKPKTVTFIMLNPSTADASEDDPTIRRCVSFARDQLANRLIVANLFAYRTKDVSELKAVRCDTDIVGPQYWDKLRRTLAVSQTVICAWGGHGKLLGQDVLAYEFIKETFNWLHALEINADGSPKHPLYILGSAKMIPYIMERKEIKTTSRFHVNILSGKQPRADRRR